MALQSSGLITLAQVQTEFGGANPISMSEYYRNGAYTTANNGNVPTSGTISLGNFYGAVKARYIEYQLIGGGGAGGYGLADGSGSGRAASGTASSITGSAITNVSAAGGAGGYNALYGATSYTYRTGSSSYFGSGGAGGATVSSDGDMWQAVGGHAPAASYGAGGGGAGGDLPQTFDQSGNSGGGGSAGTFLSSNFGYLVPGTALSVTIGTKGSGSGGNARGGNGANGFARIRADGGAWTNFTSSGTYTVS